MSRPEWVSVRQAMRTDVHLIDGRKNVLEALQLMKDGRATSLIVEKRWEKDEYGILTLSDIAKQVIARDKAPERVNVFEIMTKPVVSVHPEMDVRYCARLFERFGIRRAPVIEDGNVIGIISYYHLVLEALPDLD